MGFISISAVVETKQSTLVESRAGAEMRARSQSWALSIEATDGGQSTSPRGQVTMRIR